MAFVKYQHGYQPVDRDIKQLQENKLQQLCVSCIFNIHEICQLCATLANNTSLETLSLEKCKINKQVIQTMSVALKTNTTLRCLYFDNNCNPVICDICELLKINTTLHYIQFNVNTLQGAKYISDVLKINSTLKCMNLSYSIMTSEDIKYISDGLKENKSIDTLILNFIHINYTIALYISDIIRANNLKKLYLIGCNIGIIKSSVKFIGNSLKENTSLKELNLNNNCITDDNIKYITNALKVNNTLTKLYLNKNKIGSIGAKYISEFLKINSSLKTLELCYYNDIENIGIICICESLKENTTVRKLQMGCIKMDDSGAKHLSELLLHSVIKELSISCNQIGTLGAKYIGDSLRINTNLKTLRMIRYNDPNIEYIMNGFQYNGYITNGYFDHWGDLTIASNVFTRNRHNIYQKNVTLHSLCYTVEIANN